MKLKEPTYILPRPAAKSRSPVITALFVAAIGLLMVCPIRAEFGFSSLGHQTRMLYLDGHSTRWRMDNTSLVTSFNSERMGLRWRLELSHSEPAGDLRWGYFGFESEAPAYANSSGGRLSGRIYPFEPYTGLTLTALLPQAVAYFKSEVRFRHDDRTESFGVIGLNPIPYIGAEFKRGKVYPFPSYSELYYVPFNDDNLIGYEGGRILWNVPASVTDFKLTARYPGLADVEISHNRTELLTGQPHYGDYPLETYTGQLYGAWNHSEARFSFMPIAGWKNTLRYRELSLGCDSLTAHDGGLEFAHFGIIHGSGQLWSFTTSYRRYSLDMNWGRADGRIQGTVQAWPFLDDLYRFLGERRHFILTAKVHWFSTTVQKLLWSRAHFDLSGQLGYLLVKPDLAYVTWRPYMLGMGVDDLRADALDIRRADLICLQVNPQWKWSRLRFAAEISQWVPLHIEKVTHDTGGSGSGGGSGAGGDNSGDKTSPWGGLSISLTMTAAF